MNTQRKAILPMISQAVMVALLVIAALPASAQPPSYPPPELERLVSRVALYPDSLLTGTLAAATYANQIPDAARWADQHHYMSGQALANAIAADQLPWDPSVQALLPFPSVLGMMASDMNWTTELGNAFLAQEQQVMDAVQRLRRRASEFGYLRSNGQIVVRTGPYIEIVPARPDFVVVPYYDPGVVFVAPRPGFVAGGAIRFGFGVTIGGFFRPWGWGYNRFDWGARTVIINNNVWGRTWDNRDRYAHPYDGVRRFEPERRFEERHEIHERSEREREAPRRGDRRVEDHRERRR